MTRATTTATAATRRSSERRNVTTNRVLEVARLVVVLSEQRTQSVSDGLAVTSYDVNPNLSPSLTLWVCFNLMKSRILQFGVIFGGALLLSNGARAQESSAQNWLRALSQAEKGAQYSATATSQRDGAPTTKWRVWRKGAKNRMEYTAPPVRKGDILVDDGQDVWLYHRADNTAVQTKSRPRVLEFGALRASDTDLRVDGTQKVDGREARVLEVRRSGKIVRRLFVDEKTRVLLGSQRLTNGEEAERMTLSDLEIGDVADAKFRWNPPQGAQVVRTSGRVWLQLAPARRETSWLQAPSFVPAGFVFESAIVDNEKGEAWLRYASATARLSLFQQRATDDNSLSDAKEINGSWFWQRSGNRFLLAGAPDDDAQRIIQSVK